MKYVTATLFLLTSASAVCAGGVDPETKINTKGAFESYGPDGFTGVRNSANPDVRFGDGRVSIHGRPAAAAAASPAIRLRDGDTTLIVPQGRN